MAWSRQDILERSVDYIYGEMSETERQSYEAELARHPDLHANVLKLQRTSQMAGNLTRFPLPAASVERLRQQAVREIKNANHTATESAESLFTQLATLLFRPAAATGLVALLVVGVGVLVVEKGALQDNTPATGNQELAQQMQADEVSEIDVPVDPKATPEPAIAQTKTPPGTGPLPTGDAVNRGNFAENKPAPTESMLYDGDDAYGGATTKSGGRKQTNLGNDRVDSAKSTTRPPNKLKASPEPESTGELPPTVAVQTTRRDSVTTTATPQNADDKKKQVSFDRWENGLKSNSNAIPYPQSNQPVSSAQLSDLGNDATMAERSAAAASRADDGPQNRDATIRELEFAGDALDVPDTANPDSPEKAQWVRNIESQNVRGRAEAEPNPGSPTTATLSQPAGVITTAGAAGSNKQHFQQMAEYTTETPKRPSGDSLYDSGDYAGAIQAYERELAEKPENSAQIEHKLAIAYRKSNQFSKAIDRYQELFVRYPSYINRATALNEVAQLYLDQGRVEDAEQVADLLESINAPSTKVASLRAQIALFRTKIDKSAPQAAPSSERMKANDSKAFDNLPALKKAVSD